MCVYNMLYLKNEKLQVIIYVISNKLCVFIFIFNGREI